MFCITIIYNYKVTITVIAEFYFMSYANNSIKGIEISGLLNHMIKKITRFEEAGGSYVKCV